VAIVYRVCAIICSPTVFLNCLLILFFYFLNRPKSARLYNIIIGGSQPSFKHDYCIEQQFYGTQNRNKPSESFWVPNDSMLYSRCMQTSSLGYFSNFSFLFLLCFHFYFCCSRTTYTIRFESINNVSVIVNIYRQTEQHYARNLSLGEYVYIQSAPVRCILPY